MDPATLSLLIKAGGEAAILLINTLRQLGRPDDADEIARIVGRSNAAWQQILDKANAAVK